MKRRYNPAEKFCQPISAIEITHSGLSNTLRSPDMVAPYAARIAAGEDRDTVLTEFAMEIVELEDDVAASAVAPATSNSA